MAENFYDSLSDATLEKIAAGGDPYDSMTDQELEMVASGSWRNAAQPTAPQPAPPPRPRYTDEQRAFEQERRRRNALGQNRAEQGSPFWAGVKGALVDTPIAAAKGAFSAAKQGVEGLVVSPATGIVRLAGTPVRALTGWDGLHRLADNIDEGYRNWGADVLDQGYEDWGTALGDWGSKVAGVAGSVGGLALGGGAAKVASKLGNAGKYVAAAGKAYHAAMPWMFGNNAAVRTYDSAVRSAEERGESPNKAKALGLAAVNGAIHFLGFKLFENQSLNKMLGMPQTLEASMPAWANAAKNAGASTFSSLASGVRNGMFKYILAERAKGALKAGGIMGLQNFLSSIPQQVAEGGDVDWGRAAQEGLSGIGEGALMEGLMGGAAAWRSPKAARDFIADVYFRRGYKLPNGEVVPGLLHTPEGREFIMKQNPEAQSRILDIVEHDGEVTPAELDAACLPPMDKAELKKFVKDWKHDLEVKRWRSDEGEFLGDGEDLTGSEDVRSQNAASNEQRAVDEAWNADMPRNEAPPARSAGAGRDVLPAADAEAQQRQINDAAERDAAQRRARSADEELALFNEYNDAYRKGEIDMSFDEWLAQRAEAAPEAPGSRGAPKADNVPPEVPSAPEAAESRPAEAAPVAESPVVERANRIRRNLKPNFRHEGDPDNRLRPQPKENANETGNRPDEAQPQPPVQDAGRGGEAGTPPSEPRPPRTEPPQGAAKAEAPLVGAVEPQPAAEPPKSAPASAQNAEGATTPVIDAKTDTREILDANPVRANGERDDAPYIGRMYYDAQHKFAWKIVEGVGRNPPRYHIFQPAIMKVAGNKRYAIKEFLLSQDGTTMKEVDYRTYGSKEEAQAAFDRMIGLEAPVSAPQKAEATTPPNGAEASHGTESGIERTAEDRLSDFQDGRVRVVNADSVVGKSDDGADIKTKTRYLTVEHKSQDGKRFRVVYDYASFDEGKKSLALQRMSDDGEWLGLNFFDEYNKLTPTQELDFAAKMIDQVLGDGTFDKMLAKRKQVLETKFANRDEAMEAVAETLSAYIRPKAENAPQGGESAPDGATPKQDNKLRYATPKTEPKPAAKATDADRKAFDKEYSGKDKRNKTIRDNATDEEVRRVADLLHRSDDMLNGDGSLKDPSREGEFDAVLDEIDSVTDAILERAKKPKADNKLKPASQGKQADARQPAQEPETPVQAPVQTAKQAQKTPMQAKQSAQAAKEAKPESAQAEQEPVQATTRKAPKLRTQAEADAESEAAQAEKQRLHDEKIRGNRVQKAVEEVKAGNIDEMTMDELKTLYEDDGWHKNLGEGAEAARAAVRSAYERRYLGNKRSGKYPSVIKALDWLERRPDNALAIAKAHDALSKSLEKAKYNGDSFGEDLLTRHLVSLNDRIANMPADMKNKVVKELGKIASKFTPMERKGRQSLDTGEGGTMDVEDKRGEASIREHAALGEVDAENASRQQALADYEGRNDAGNKEESSRLGRVERSDDDATNTSVGPSRGGTGTGGSLSGKRKFQIVERDGDDVTVAMRLPGKGIVSRKMKIDQLRALGEADPDIKRVIDELERGDEIRASKVSVSDFPQGVPAKWSAAAKKSVEGAWRVARNFIPGAKVEFADRLPDGDGAELKNDKGVTVGKWDRAGNRVTLLPGADASTVAHELGGHGAWQFAEQEAKAGRGGLLERLNGVVDAENAITKEAWDYVKKHYSDAPEAVQREEVLARIIGRKGGEAIDRTVKTLEGKAWYNRAWQAIKDAIRGMMARMGFNRADLSQIDRMTPDETMDWLVKQMTEGKTLGRVERENGVDNAPKQAREDSSVVWDDDGARESRAPAAAGTPIMDEKRTFGEKAREATLDSDAPFRDLQDEVGGVQEKVRADGYTDHRTSTDFVAAKDKYNGRLEHDMRGLQRRVDEVKADLNAARLDTQKSKTGSEEMLKDFNLFLAAEHAAERNRTHAKENGVAYTPDYYKGMGKVKYDNAEEGFSERLADKIRSDLRAKYGAKFSHFEDAAQKAYKIAADELKRRLDGDLLSQADYDYYHDRVASGEWKHYVPLKTDRARLGIDDGDIPLGTKLHRNEYRKASGRGETVAELAPYTDLVLQAEQGIKKSLLNELANVEANFIEHATNVRGFKDANGNSLIAEIVPGEDLATHGKNYEFVFKDGSSVVSEGSSRLAGNHPEIHLFKRGGRLYAIRYVKGKFGRGLDVAKAASGDNVKSWGNDVLSKVPKFTGLMSAMRTQYSPEFTVSNWLADSLEAAQALVGRYGVWDGAKAFAKTVAAEARNAKDVWRYLRRGELRGDVKKAVEAGLLTKGGVASEGFEGKEANIRDRLDEFRRQSEGFWRLKNPVDKAKWVAEHVKEYLGMANEFMEYSTRIGLFSALHNKGVPVQDAVKFARDATVNFNRKGTLMPLINGLYMFANASVQGAARAVQAGKESFQSLPDDGSGWGRHKAKGDLVALLVAVGAAQAVMDHFLGNDEERERAGGKNARNRSEYDKKHNVGIPLPGGYNMPIMRFRGPYAAIPYLAQTATNVALGDAKPEDAAWALARETTDQITDLVGGNGVFNDKNEVDGSLLWQSVAPSAVDPVVQLMSGKDYKGEERLRRSFDKNAPVSWNGKRNTSEAYKKTAQMLNWLTGGNSLRKGKIDIAPEDAQLVWEFIWGGLGRDISNFASTLQNVSQAAAGGKPERLLQDIPLGRRLVREYPESTGRYYDALDEYERDKTEYRKTTEMKRKAALRRARPYLTQSGNGRVDVLASEIKNLQHLERGEVLVGQKWVEPKTPRSEAQKEKYRERRLRLQAQVLKIFGE